jgi:hypothetical protein
VSKKISVPDQILMNGGPITPAMRVWMELITRYVAAASSGAPVDAQYVTMALNGDLTAERVLTAGSGISITDGGANGNVTIAATGGGGVDVEDDDVSILAPASVLNFSGLGVTVTDGGSGQADIAIPGSLIGSASTTMIWGNGEDGDVDLDGTNDYPSLFNKSGSQYQANVKNLMLNNCTIRNGSELIGRGTRILIAGTLTIEAGGKIHANAVSRSSTGGSTGGTIYGQAAAGALGGNNANGSNGGNATNAAGGNGGAGGNASIRTGGTGGVVTPPIISNGGLAGFYSFFCFETGRSQGSGTSVTIGAGAGGGGGASNSAGFPGGNGGAGGGVLGFAARVITGAGSVEAKGFGGTDGSAGGVTGGGGGGGGGVVIMATTTHNWQSIVTVDVSGGAGGVGANGGTNGADGSAGRIIQLLV